MNYFTIMSPLITEKLKECYISLPSFKVIFPTAPVCYLIDLSKN